MKKYLFVLRQAAHQGNSVQEMLDIILITAAFDQQVSLLLLDDAVFQLKNNQQAEKYGYKETGLIFKALEIYDVNEIYTEIESLDDYGLKTEDLLLPVKVLPRGEIAHLMKNYDVVFTA
ncbi:MAG: sulfurtransferase complex subunit TusC [Methylococcales bacterium]|nr:sulfurtransferase complex subunit TusC [Methylococcales bacterium]